MKKPIYIKAKSILKIFLFPVKYSSSSFLAFFIIFGLSISSLIIFLVDSLSPLKSKQVKYLFEISAYKNN